MQLSDMQTIDWVTFVCNRVTFQDTLRALFGSIVATPASLLFQHFLVSFSN